jgi:Zn-dependent protease
VELFANFPMNLERISLFGLLSLMAAPAFILHELAHKFVAQRYGYWGEFRLHLLGVLITAVAIVSPFKLAGPGAVVIKGDDITEKENGKISMAGPFTNFILIGIFLLCVPFFSLYTINNRAFLVILAQLNAILAVFNLLPFSVLDGKKVFSWNKGLWFVGFALSGGMWFITLLFRFDPLIWVLIAVGVLIIAGLTYRKVYAGI